MMGGEDKKRNSVKNLANLYTVVIGVALSLSIVQLLDAKAGLAGIKLQDAMLFVSLVVTLFPFYHGALRHLDDSYIEDPGSRINDFALILDFILLFIHGVAFVVLALLLDHPSQFAWVVVIILSIDVIWGIFVCFGPSSNQEHGAEGKWTLINTVFLFSMALVFVLADVGFDTSGLSSMKLSAIVMTFCVLRTLADYIVCREFYFPR